MTDEDINKRIYELLGWCYHELSSVDVSKCKHCNLTNNPKDNLDFTTSWEGFGILITWWQKQEQLAEFANTHESWYQGQNIPINLISPRGLAEATVRFFKENK